PLPGGEGAAGDEARDRDHLGGPAGPGASLLLADQLLNLLGGDLTAQGGQRGGAARGRFLRGRTGDGDRLLDPGPGVVGRLSRGLARTGGGVVGGLVDLRR